MWKFLSDLFSSGRKKPSPKAMYFESTSSQSQDRIRKLGLDVPSEDASYILDASQLTIPMDLKQPASDKYIPDPRLHWVIDLERANAGQFTRNELWRAFDADWRKKFGASDVHGHASEESRWAYVIAGDSPEKYDQVQVALQLVNRYPEDNIGLEESTFREFLYELQKRIDRELPDTVFRLAEDIPAAIKKGEGLLLLQTEFERDLIIGLKSDSIFPGMLAWDTLLSVGLKWGDQDFFHWGNSNMDLGNDQLFSVWSGTPPGYFFPENVKAGKYNPENLFFGFSIPRCADPLGVFDHMVDAITYCQKRLGGTIVNSQGAPFDMPAERVQLSEFLTRMRGKGLIPGATLALRIY
jgi:hypothetical protein